MSSARNDLVFPYSRSKIMVFSTKKGRRIKSFPDFPYNFSIFQKVQRASKTASDWMMTFFVITLI